MTTDLEKVGGIVGKYNGGPTGEKMGKQTGKFVDILARRILSKLPHEASAAGSVGITIGGTVFGPPGAVVVGGVFSLFGFIYHVATNPTEDW